MEKSKNITRNLYFPERIEIALVDTFNYPLTIVEAPMGYGKTTAVSACLNNAEAMVLWLRIFEDSANNFWTGFCSIIYQYNPEASQSLEQLGFPDDSVSRQEALNLIAAIEFPKKTMIVIDDYHLVEGAEMNAFIDYIVRNEIANLSILLTLRYTGFENIDELKLKGYLKHITKETFEFDHKEIKAYYKACGINLKSNEVDKLYNITEGWISALYLMMLNFIEEGNFSSNVNIYKLVEKTLYTPLSDETKELLQLICHFDNFTLSQAIHMSEKQNAEMLLLEITSRNTLIKYNEKTRTYQMHNIFTKLLKDIFEGRNETYKKENYKKAAHWYLKLGEYNSAMHYYEIAEDFDMLMNVVETDKGHAFHNDNKGMLIQYLEKCPNQVKVAHPIALLVYAINLFMFNEFERFDKACSEFLVSIQSNESLDGESLNNLMGEYELLLSFTGYNDIGKMLEHIKKAVGLLKQPAKFIDTKEGWTFGAPSVLYMFYRETGKLDADVQTIKEALPFYSQITNGHGKGGELVMEAEWHFNSGDIQNAEIIAHKAVYEAKRAEQYDIVICAKFLQARIALFKGDYVYIRDIPRKLHEDMAEEKKYTFMHIIDLGYAFIQAGLKRNQKIPNWIENADFESSRLFFPAMAFMNIVYGRVLLINGENTKLLGNAEQFIGIASVFPNLLGQIYTYIYIAAANHQIYRNEDAQEALKFALDIAMPDKVYMPFVENGDYISPLLEELFHQGLYREDVTRILALYRSYQKGVEQIIKASSDENIPILAGRETEIAQLAAEGFSNKEIGERLFVTQNTVKTVLKRVFEKLDISAREMLKNYSFEQIEK